MPRWKEAELEYFEKGIQKHGIGKWQQILNDESFHFHPDRKAKSLSDKYQASQQPKRRRQQTYSFQHKVPGESPPHTCSTPVTPPTLISGDAVMQNAREMPLAWTAPWSDMQRQTAGEKATGWNPHQHILPSLTPAPTVTSAPIPEWGHPNLIHDSWPSGVSSSPYTVTVLTSSTAHSAAVGAHDNIQLASTSHSTAHDQYYNWYPGGMEATASHVGTGSPFDSTNILKPEFQVNDYSFQESVRDLQLEDLSSS